MVGRRFNCDGRMRCVALTTGLMAALVAALVSQEPPFEVFAGGARRSLSQCGSPVVSVTPDCRAAPLGFGRPHSRSTARSGLGGSAEQMQRIVQALLEDRFKPDARRKSLRAFAYRCTDGCWQCPPAKDSKTPSESPVDLSCSWSE